MENRENQKMEDQLKAPTTLLPSKSTIVKDSDNDFIEDALDKPGTIAKAKLHGSANRILNIPKTFESDQKVEFCDDCYLPEKTKGVVEEFQFDVDPKRLAIAGYNIYLFFCQAFVIILQKFYISCFTDVAFGDSSDNSVQEFICIRYSHFVSCVVADVPENALFNAVTGKSCDIAGTL